MDIQWKVFVRTNASISTSSGALGNNASYSNATPDRAAVMTMFIPEISSSSLRRYTPLELASRPNATLEVGTVAFLRRRVYVSSLELPHETNSPKSVCQMPQGA